MIINKRISWLIYRVIILVIQLYTKDWLNFCISTAETSRLLVYKKISSYIYICRFERNKKVADSKGTRKKEITTTSIDRNASDWGARTTGLSGWSNKRAIYGIMRDWRNKDGKKKGTRKESCRRGYGLIGGWGQESGMASGNREVVDRRREGERTRRERGKIVGDI